MSDAPEVTWQQVIATVEHRECSAYSNALRAAVAAASATSAEQLRLFAEVTGMVLSQGAGIEPLKPLFSTPTSHSAIPGDLSKHELDQLRRVLVDVEDAELDARICDVLWTRERSQADARRAIDSYMSAAMRLEGTTFAWRIRVERALAFIVITKDQDRGLQLSAYIRSKLVDDKPSQLTLAASEMLLRCGDDEPGVQGARAESYALAATENSDIYLARGLYACAVTWHRKNKDFEAERRCRIAEAETYATEAERSSDADSALLMKANFYTKAIEAFRRVGKCRERVEELHRKLLQVQGCAAATMKDVQGPTVDLTDTALGAIKEIDGCSFPQALLRLATMVTMPSCDETRARALKLASEFQLSAFFGRQTVTEKGRVVLKTPGWKSGDGSADEVALLSLMHEQHEQLRGCVVAGVIEPVRRKILLDHPATEQDLMPLVTNNPIVPEGRERLFARGLYAGLAGDFVQAAHVLIPQIEHAVRALLNRADVITTSLSTEGIQEEFSLGALLDKPELIDVVGQDRVFDMKSLLTERAGTNLRNKAAHGLISNDQFYSAPCVYVWWLALHLCFLPTIAALAESGERDAYPSS